MFTTDKFDTVFCAGVIKPSSRRRIEYWSYKAPSGYYVGVNKQLSSRSSVLWEEWVRTFRTINKQKLVCILLALKNESQQKESPKKEQIKETLHEVKAI